MPRIDTAVDLTMAVRGLVAATDTVDRSTLYAPRLAVLTRSAPDCVALAGLLTALVDRLAGRLPGATGDLPAPDPVADIAADLATMRGLLDRAARVAGPAVATLPRDTDGGELGAVRLAVSAALDTLASGPAGPELWVLAEAMPGCVRLTGLLGILTGALSSLADLLATPPRMTGRPVGIAAEPLVVVAVDLATMHSLLHRATLVAAPLLADLHQSPPRRTP